MNGQQGDAPQISKTGHQLVRLLISSYFIGAATGVIPFDSGRVLAALLLPDSMSGYGFSVFLFTTAYLILIGQQIRAAALLLALFVFWASYIASFGPARTLGYQEFWRDLALIGGLLLTYADRPAAYAMHAQPGRIRLGRKVAPRRVAAAKTATARPTTGATLGPSRNRTGYAAFEQSPDDMASLFDQVFEIR